MFIQLGQNQNGYGGDIRQFTNDEQTCLSSHHNETKSPLKLVMDPRGIVQDMRNTGTIYDYSGGMLSPDKCAELVSALQTDAPKGKGNIETSTSVDYLVFASCQKNTYSSYVTDSLIHLNFKVLAYPTDEYVLQ